ncbi:hypothetical protein WJX79_001788 [Trebouxia sp. C0005]
MAAAHVLISGHHASSHQASEFLQDRLPNSQTTFALKADEIAVAYGERAMPKLVEVLSLPDLSDACSIECLQLLLSLLSSQERKGRLAILQASGLKAVIAALGKAPKSGIICLQVFSVSIDGSAALLDCSENASEALVHSLQQSVPEARPAVQAAGAIPLLAKLCDLDQWSLDVVRYASAALASIAVGPDVKVGASVG